MKWQILWQYRDLLLDGLRLTVLLSVISMAFALVVGTAIGIVRTADMPGARSAARAYVELQRNTPLIVKLFLLYFAFGFGEFFASVAALVLHQSGYIGEVVRAGIQSVPRGQWEAAFASGLTRWQSTRLVVGPQALRAAVPPLTSQMIEVIKNSSVAMTVTVAELTFQTQAIEHATFRGFEAATAVTALYGALALSISLGMGRFERTLRVGM